jgi:hypothetical protein
MSRFLAKTRNSPNEANVNPFLGLYGLVMNSRNLPKRSQCESVRIMRRGNEHPKSAERSQRESVWIMRPGDERAKSAERSQIECVWVMQAGKRHPKSAERSQIESVWVMQADKEHMKSAERSQIESVWVMWAIKSCEIGEPADMCFGPVVSGDARLVCGAGRGASRPERRWRRCCPTALTSHSLLLIGAGPLEAEPEYGKRGHWQEESNG